MPGSITYRHSTGARLTGVNSKTITSISAAGVVTTSAWSVTPVVGEIMEIFGTQPNFNKGFFAVIAATSTTVTLAPKPRATGTLGNIAKTTQFTQYTLTGASNVTEIIALDAPLAYLRVSDANFKDAGVKRNDRVQIAGSSTTRNNGSWIIHAVLSNTTLVIRPYDKGEFPQSQSASGTIIVRPGRIRVAINNVAANSWSKTANIGVSRPGPYGSRFYRLCSGSITDYLRINNIGDNSAENKSFVELAGIQFIDFYLSAPRGATFYSLNEVAVVTHGVSGVTGIGDCVFTAINAASWPGELTVELGDNTGNRYSAGNGSVWVAISSSAIPTSRTNVYGSYMDVTGTNEITLGAGNVTGSIIRPRTNMGTGVVESLTAYGDLGNASGGLSGSAAGDQANLLVTKQGTTASAISAACIISGLLVSDKLLSPIAFNNNVTAGGVVEIRDPRIDIDLNDYFSNTFSDGKVIKTYEFNPRFVYTDSLTNAPTPVFYLTVDVIGINENDLTLTALIHDTTNQQGLLVGGARYLTRQSIDGSAETSTLSSHRVVVHGAGFVIHNAIIQLAAPLTGDWSIKRIAADYEGEFGE